MRKGKKGKNKKSNNQQSFSAAKPRMPKINIQNMEYEQSQKSETPKNIKPEGEIKADIKPEKKKWTTSEIISGISLFVSLCSLITAGFSFCTNTRSVNFTIDATKKQNRAYVIVDTIAPFKITQDTIYRNKITIKNIGKTPAYNVQFLPAILFHYREQDVDTSFFQADFHPYHPKDVIGADRQIVDLTPQFKTRPLDFQDFITGKVTLFVLIKISYTDVFGEKHKTVVFAKRQYNEQFFTYCDKFNSIE